MFTAVLMPDDVVAELDDFLEPRRAAGGPPRAAGAGRDRAVLRWTRPESWHITLGFMPQVESRRLDDLVERMTRAGTRRRRFELRLRGGGAFPSAVDARVLYARAEGEPAELEELRRLAVGARAAGARAGVEVHGGRFRPHVTLARSRRPDDVSRWLTVLDTFTSSTWPVQEFALVRSELGQGPRGSPRYVVEELFSLRADP